MKRHLILVEGIPGTGKSTTAQFLETVLRQNQIDALWYSEEQINNPLYPPFIWENMSCVNLDDYLAVHPTKWRDFIQQSEKKETVSIFDSMLMNFSLPLLIRQNIDPERIELFWGEVVESLNDIDATLIYYHKKDVASHLKSLWKQRGQWWEDHLTRFFEVSPFAQSRNLTGQAAPIRFWEEYQTYADMLVAKLGLKKLIFESDAQHMDLARSKVLESLGILVKAPLELTPQSAAEIAGKYVTDSDISQEITIRAEGSRLFLDFVWDNTLLIPTNQGEFALEAWPLKIELFQRNGESGLILSGEPFRDPRREWLGKKFMKVKILE